MAQKLLFENTEIATPTTFKITHKKIMSSNAGLTSNCAYVGDVKGIETVIHVEWANLKPQEIIAINQFIMNIGNLFFQITYLDEEFKVTTQQVRADDTTYEQWGWDTHRQLCRVLSLDLHAYSGN